MILDVLVEEKRALVLYELVRDDDVKCPGNDLIPDADGMHSQLCLVLKSERKREFFEIDDLNRIELFVDRALDHTRDDGAAKSGGAVDIDVVNVDASKQLLCRLVEFEINGRVGRPAKVETADERRAVITCKCDRSVDLAVAKPDGRSY